MMMMSVMMIMVMTMQFSVSHYDDVGDEDDDDVIQGLSLTQPVLAKGRKSGRAKQSLYWRPMIANISLPASLPFHKSKAWKYFSNRHLMRADREMINSDEAGEM